jgi:nitrite reductase (NADH) large subunit
VKRRVLIAGFGMAAQRLLEELAPLEADGLQVTVLSEEPCVAYDRIKLSSALAQAGERGAPADLSLKPAGWHAAHGFELRLGVKAESLDVARRVLVTEGGESLAFDDLVLATGSQPILPPLPGIGFEGVHVFRRLADCQALAAAARPGLRVVVVGGGLLGLEAAKGLLNLGCQVSVVHLADRLMERQLDVRAAAYLQADLERQGLRFELEAQTEALLGGPGIEGLRLKDGRTLPAQLLVFAIGVRPEVGLARTAGLVVNRGILVDDHLRSSAPGIWALGECAEHRGVAYGLVAPLYEQAATLAKRLAGMENAPYTGSKVYTRLKVAGLEVFSCGELSPARGSNLIVEDAMAGIYKRAQFNGKRLSGAVLYGDSAASNRLLKALDLDDAVEEVRAAFGLKAGAATSPLEGMASVDLVCNCNQVSLGALRQAIQAHGCRNVDQVQACTAASSSCGSCRPLVESVLREASPTSPTLTLSSPPPGGALAAISSAANAGALRMVGASS